MRLSTFLAIYKAGRKRFENLQISHLQLPKEPFPNLYIKHSVLEQFEAEQSILDYFTIVCSTVTRSSFYQTHFGASIFKECQLTQVDFQAASMQDVYFTDCELNQVDLSSTNLERASIYHSKLRQVSLVNAKLDNLHFQWTELQELYLSSPT